MSQAAQSIRTQAGNIQTSVDVQTEGVSTEAASGQVSAASGSISNAIANLESINMDGLDEGTKAAIKRSIEPAV